jgi:hypothetical protein
MPDAKQSIILGGIVTGILSTSYLGLINIVCCLGVIVGAMVTVWHYTDTNELTIPTGKGATLGIGGALIGLVISTILNLILVKAGINHETAIQEFVINRFADSMPPEQLEAMEAELMTQKSLVEHVTGFATGAAVFTAFGAIGGSIAAKLFKKGGEEPTVDATIDEL